MFKSLVKRLERTLRGKVRPYSRFESYSELVLCQDCGRGRRCDLSLRKEGRDLLRCRWGCPRPLLLDRESCLRSRRDMMNRTIWKVHSDSLKSYSMKPSAQVDMHERERMKSSRRDTCKAAASFWQKLSGSDPAGCK